MPHKSIKDVRRTMQLWGNFWASQESLQGYASKSNIQALKETLDVGCAAQGTLHLYSHLADNMYVPPHIEEIDEAIKHLTQNQRLSISQKYIKRKKVKGKIIDDAERMLLVLL